MMILKALLPTALHLPPYINQLETNLGCTNKATATAYPHTLQNPDQNRIFANVGEKSFS
jgi:hypothetical protein